MIGIPVSVAPPTREGRLYPRYQNRSGILTLQTKVPRACPFGINIDGSVILDFDHGGLLAGVELLRPMRRWKGKSILSDPAGAAGNLLLSAPYCVSAAHDWPVTVSKDMQTGAGRIAFGNGAYDHSVSLSETCRGLLLDHLLTGFWFTLAR
jgi:hypothetical protein